MALRKKMSIARVVKMRTARMVRMARTGRKTTTEEVAKEYYQQLKSTRASSVELDCLMLVSYSTVSKEVG